MRILFAAPDRDLLACYKQLLEADLGETVTAFDGTRVLSLLSEEAFDFLILDQKIPRVDHNVITERANGKNIPVLVLTDEPAGRRGAENPSPNGRLSYPFPFARLREAARDTMEKNRGKEVLRDE